MIDALLRDRARGPSWLIFRQSVTELLQRTQLARLVRTRLIFHPTLEEHHQLATEPGIIVLSNPYASLITGNLEPVRLHVLHGNISRVLGQLIGYLRDLTREAEAEAFIRREERDDSRLCVLDRLDEVILPVHDRFTSAAKSGAS